MATQSSPKGDTSGKNDRLFSIISIAIGCAIALYLAEWMAGTYIRYIQHSDQMEVGLLRYHSSRGWQLNPGWQGKHKHYDYEATYTINALGYRGGMAAVSKENECERVAIVGDSFTFGFGVNENETFSARLNTKQNSVECQTQYLNYGVPGTSTDQQLLLMQEQIFAMQPDRILWVVYLANDLFDNLLNYPLQAEQAKPVFQLDRNGALILTNVPVPKQAKPAALRGASLSSVVLAGVSDEKSWWVRMLEQWSLYAVLGMESLSAPVEGWHTLFDTNFSEALELYSALLSEGERHASEKNIELELMVLAGRSWHVSPESVSGLYQEYLRQQVLAIADKKGIYVRDVATALKNNQMLDQGKLFFPYDGHLTTLGHEVVAQVIEK